MSSASTKGSGVSAAGSVTSPASAKSRKPPSLDEASALLAGQWEEQRSDLQGLTRRLARANRLRPGLGEARTTATLHMLTSLESFLWLRREYGLSLRQTRDTIAELARQVLRS